MDRELDSHDVHLLKTIAALGEAGPRTLDEQRRLDRLEMERYVLSVRHDPPGLDAPPAWNYRLTSKGQAVLKS